MPRQSIEQPRRGFALILVLWVAGLAGLLGLLIMRTVQTEQHLARNQIEAMQAEALADGAIYWAIGLLATSTQDSRLAGPVRPQVEPFFGRVGVTIQPVAGLIDLNSEPQAVVLAGLLQALGVPEPEALALTARIADWRDEDDTPRPGGAEAPAYQAAGRPGPLNAPFQSVSALRGVLGLSPDLAARLAPYVTVRSGGILDVGFSPAPVRLAVAAVGGAAPAGNVTESRGPRPRVPVYRLTATARLDSGTVAVRSAAVLIRTSSAGPSFQFLEWTSAAAIAGLS
ncbi:MAG: general secretion pathway protein GspK [Rhodothalassiaceae bacterium]